MLLLHVPSISSIPTEIILQDNLKKKVSKIILKNSEQVFFFFSLYPRK